MKIKIISLLFAVIIIPVFFFFSSSRLYATQNGFKVYVLVIPSKNFKYAYTARYYYYEDRESRSVYEIQDELKGKLKSKLGTHKDMWEIVFCKTKKEFEGKANDTGAYLFMKVELEQYKTKYIDSDLDDHDYSELTANCEIYKRSGNSLLKSFSRKLTAKSTDSNDEEYFVTSIEKMAEDLDIALINNLISYQALSSISKDAHTKQIKVKAMNTSPFTIKSLTWGIPAENESFYINTDNYIKVGETVAVIIIVRSNKSHASIQWRNVFISEIEFDRSAK